MAKIVYPLEQVLEIKKKRVTQQEKIVKQKEEELKKEEEILKEKEKERDKVKQHLEDKINQMFEEFSNGTTSDKIIQIRNYIKIVKEKLKDKEKKVDEQKEQVKIAEKNLDEAKEELKRKRQEVDKLKNHRKDWIKAMKLELQVIEDRELDEIGNISYLAHMRKNKTLSK